MIPNKVLGKKIWLIPDCELPPEGEGILKGHESVIIVNDSDKDAHINVDIFFTEEFLESALVWVVPAKRVRCFRTNNSDDMGGVVVPLEQQYAMKLTSDTPVTVQYGRLDNRQTNLAYYTVIPYSE